MAQNDTPTQIEPLGTLVEHNETFTVFRDVKSDSDSWVWAYDPDTLELCKCGTLDKVVQDETFQYVQVPFIGDVLK